MAVSQRRFSKKDLDALDRAKILGLRSGSEHKYTGVWVVVVEQRVFVRSWSDKPTGWFRAFKAQPSGSISIEGKDRPIRGRTVRSERLRRAVSDAYGAKYNTKASQKWVSGFAEGWREANTLELVPA